MIEDLEVGDVILGYIITTVLVRGAQDKTEQRR